MKMPTINAVHKHYNNTCTHLLSKCLYTFRKQKYCTISTDLMIQRYTTYLVHFKSITRAWHIVIMSSVL